MFEIGRVFSFSKIIKNLTTKGSLKIIIILGVIVFFNGLFNDFVIDDNSQIADNALFLSITNIPSFFTGSTFYGGGGLVGVYFKPITFALLSVIYNIFGPQPFWFHLFQIALHISNAAILFLLFKSFFSKQISLFLALVFLVHPINSETVFYISNMQDVLFFTFGIFSLWLIVNFQLKRHFTSVLLLLFLSILSKETGILFFCISIFHSFQNKKKQLYYLLGFSVLILAIYFLLRVNSVGVITKPMNAPIASLSFQERLINIPAIFFFYLKTFLIPINLSSSYQWVYREISINNFYLPLVVDVLVLSIFALAALKLHRMKLRKYFNSYIFFLLWFNIGILIHVQIIPIDATVAERWFYFPIVGLLGMIGVFLQLFSSQGWTKRLMISASIFILVFLSSRTIARSFDWRNGLRLASHDIQFSKDSYTLENRIGYGLMNEGRLEEAKAHLEKSIELYPYLTNYNNLGVTYMRLNDYKRAKEAFINSLKFGEYYLVYENLAGLGLVYGDPGENIKSINKYLQKHPENSRLWFYLAILEYRVGNSTDAKVSITKAYRLDRNSQINYVYTTIMNDQPLNPNFKIDQ